MRKTTSYSTEQKALAIKEALESGSIPSVASKYNIPAGTIYTWVAQHRNAPALAINYKDQEIRRLKKLLEEEKIKTQVMSELLKKTYQLWGPEK